MDQKHFIDLVAPMAQETHRKYRVPASVTIAQAALESGWGGSVLAVQAKALFGIKYGNKWNENLSPYVKGSYSVVSTEFINGQWVNIESPFCAYSSWNDSILDHGPFLLRPVYANAFLPTVVTSNDFARAIHTAGYATDPAYSDKLISLMKTHNLYQYDIQKVDVMSNNVILLGASKQQFNQYAGGPSGIDDSEAAWLQKLAEGTAKELSPFIETHVAPFGDINKSGKIDFNDNVAWANDKIKQLRAQGKRVILWDTMHSNAMGDSMVLSGQGSASITLRKLFIEEFNRNNIMPFGDVWTPNDRLVSEMAKVDAPSILTEFGQHDRVDYAQWLRENITNGTLAKWNAQRILNVLNIKTGEPLVSTTPLPTPAPVPKPSPAPASNPHTPLQVDGLWGSATTRALQYTLRNKYNAWGIGAPLVVDGVVGKNTYRALQRVLNQEIKAGLTEDGLFGPQTKRALQRYLGVTVDGIVGKATVSAMQTKLNNGSF